MARKLELSHSYFAYVHFMQTACANSLWKKETYLDNIVRSWLLVPKASEANFAFKTWVYGIQSAFKMCIWQ